MLLPASVYTRRLIDKGGVPVSSGRALDLCYFWGKGLGGSTLSCKKLGVV